MENNYIVYKHTCKDNGKVYIGLTGMSLIERTGNNGEGYLHKKKNGNWVQPQIARAIIKYGWDNFDHEILFANLTKEEADKKEKEMIDFYDSRNPQKGYNTREGGSNGPLSEETKQKLKETMEGRYDGEKNPFYGRKHSEETKEAIRKKNKIHASNRDISGENNPMYGRKLTAEEIKKRSEAQKGKRHSEESKKKMSEARKEWYKNHPDYERPERTEEHKEKMRQAMLGREMDKDWKRKIGEGHAPYYCICVETGEKFPSFAEAGRQKGVDKASIQRVVSGKQNTAGGFHWVKEIKQ